MRRLLLALALALSLPPGLAAADVPRVSADILPVHGLVSAVMEGLGTPDLIVPPAGDAHHYALRPSEARALSQADVVFHVGAALTPWFGEAAATLSAGAISVELLDLPGTVLLDARETAVFGPTDDRSHDHEAHDGHDHGAIDPHAWLSPQNAEYWLDVIAGTLAGADPANAETYRANADAAARDIQAASAEVAALLSATPPAPVAVLHDAYGYFEEAFGLKVAGAITASDANAPGAQRIADLRNQLADAGIACVIAEPGTDPKLAHTVFGALPVIAADPIGRDLPAGPEFYPALIRALGTAFGGCP